MGVRSSILQCGVCTKDIHLFARMKVWQRLKGNEKQLSNARSWVRYQFSDIVFWCVYKTLCCTMTSVSIRMAIMSKNSVYIYMPITLSLSCIILIKYIFCFLFYFANLPEVDFQIAFVHCKYSMTTCKKN